LKKNQYKSEREKEKHKGEERRIDFMKFCTRARLNDIFLKDCVLIFWGQ